MNFKHKKNVRIFGWMAAGVLACSLAFVTPAFADSGDEGPAVPSNIYHWVQSTARQNYYFNRQQMCYAIKDGKIDSNVLIVPTLRTYDDIQIQDVVSKRRWNMEPLDGYDRLAGAAEYLRIDRKAGTVTIERHDDLDSDFATIREESEPVVIEMKDLSEKDVEGRFYRAILKYADKHDEALTAKTEEKLK